MVRNQGRGDRGAVLVPDSMRTRTVARDARRGRRQPASPARALTAAASLGSAAFGARNYLTSIAAEDEMWSFYYTLGEFASFVDWMARAMSRVRLGAAELAPGADEPEMLTEGPAADLASQFYGGTPGQAAFMEAIVPQLLVPGQGWLVPERWDPGVPLVLADWSVQSTATYRETTGRGVEIQIAPGTWRPLLPDALPCRIWMPDQRFPYLAKSPAVAALPIMRRIDLIDKRIVAELLSRLVMNGIMWIPQEGELPSSPEYLDQADPFFAELIDIAGRNIQTPGSALAAVPMPVKYPGDLISKISLMKFNEPFDEQLLVERDRELGRLAKTLPLSQERQQGFGDANHWNGFLVSEDDIKISIAPLAEVIANGATVGFLQPMLATAGQSLVGPNGGKIVMWPDYSELTAKPDNREAFQAMYDRGEVNGIALRRESGASESDKPTQQEQTEMIWLKAARDGSNPANPTAVQQLTGVEIATPQPPAAGPSPVGPATDAPASPASSSAAAAPAAGSQPPDQAPLSPDEAISAAALGLPVSAEVAQWARLRERVNGSR